MTGKVWCPEKGLGNATHPLLGPLEDMSLPVFGKYLLRSTLVARHRPVARQEWQVPVEEEEAPGMQEGRGGLVLAERKDP